VDTLCDTPMAVDSRDSAALTVPAAPPTKISDSRFAGRTVQLVEDLSLDEQIYLYERLRRLKAKRQSADIGAKGETSMAPPLCEISDGDLVENGVDPDSAVYLLFMENSTRTKDSFRNAASFHGVKVNEFHAQTSSFQKNETITDTIKMLSLYSIKRSIFVIRSPIEGVCRWLETAIPPHTDRFGIPTPCFVNAGDGSYTHPVAELVDVYSLLEASRWDRSSIHLALVGDLFHGRTAHSKVEGLKVFRKVRVDLVAPEIFAYPVEYRDKMRANGFEVREYRSIEDYIANASDDLAHMWHFLKPQYDRIGDVGQDRIDELHAYVSFRTEWKDKLPSSGCTFFQALPRDKARPVIPLELDSSELNGWDRSANNGYFLGVVLLGVLFSAEADGGETTPKKRTSSDSQIPPTIAFSPPSRLLKDRLHLPEFIKPVELTKPHKRNPDRADTGRPVPIANGVVLDHIGIGADPQRCWRRIRMVRTILQWANLIGIEGVLSSKTPGYYKGLISLPNFDFEKVTVPEMKMLAAIAPGCTLNAISDSHVANKYRLMTPPRIYDLPNLRCVNAPCVSNPQTGQRDVVPSFERVPFYHTSALNECAVGKRPEFLFVCKYCRWPHRYEDLWLAGSS